MQPTPETPAREESSTPRLEYAPRPRLPWISRYRRLFVFLAFCIAIALSIHWYWQPLKQRALWLYWFHQAAAHRMPASVELSVTDPQRASKILAENDEYAPQTVRPSATQPAVTTAWYIPESYRRLSALDPRLNLVTEAVSPTPLTMPLSFLGTLHRPDGIARLVIIHNSGIGGNDFNQRTPALVLPLPGLFDPMPQGNYPRRAYGITGPGSGRYSTLALLTASADPSDSTHLVIPYAVQIGNRYSDPAGHPAGQGEFDVYLQNDDSLLFKPRAGSRTGTSLPASLNAPLAGALALPEIHEPSRVEADPKILEARRSMIYQPVTPRTLAPGYSGPPNR